MRVIGKNQCRMLAFAEKYKGWHTIGKDKATKQAAKSLSAKEYIEVSGDQFRFTYPR